MKRIGQIKSPAGVTIQVSVRCGFALQVGTWIIKDLGSDWTIDQIKAVLSEKYWDYEILF